MVSWSHLVQKTLDSNGLMDHPTSLYRGKNADGNSLTRQKKKMKKKKGKKERKKENKADLLQ